MHMRSSSVLLIVIIDRLFIDALASCKIGCWGICDINGYRFGEKTEGEYLACKHCLRFLQETAVPPDSLLREDEDRR
jgi:hypothetical protein